MNKNCINGKEKEIELENDPSWLEVPQHQSGISSTWDQEYCGGGSFSTFFEISSEELLTALVFNSYRLMDIKMKQR